MTESGRKPLTSDEKQLLRFALILRRLQKTDSGSPPIDTWWEKVLQSTVVATLVTVVLGGWVSNCVVANYQERAKAEERALLNLREETERRYKATIAAYELLGDANYCASILSSLTQPEMQIHNVDKDFHSSLLSQRTTLSAIANGFIRDWERKKFTTGLSLTMYRPSVRKEWDSAVATADTLLNATSASYWDYLANPRKPRDDDFSKEAAALADAISTFGNAISAEHNRK